MSETKNILIIAATVLLAVVIFCFGNRYQMVGAATNYIYCGFMCDRMTGRAWAVNGDEYVKVTKKEEPKKQPLQTIAEFRKKYPQYNDVSEQELADFLYKKFYSDIPREKFMAEFLRKPPPERPLGEPN
jgi:hypothetical protein